MLPDYVKIDKHFIQKPHKDSIKLNIVKSILNMTTLLNCKVIAEGIKTPDELKAIEKIMPRVTTLASQRQPLLKNSTARYLPPVLPDINLKQPSVKHDE